MDWMAALLARANGDGTLDALIDGRAAWGYRKQGDRLPGLTLFVVADARPQHLKGFDLQASRVQLDGWGATHKQAWDVAEAAIAALVPGGVFYGHRFARAMVELAPRDLIERVGTETIYRVSMDLTFHHAVNAEGS